METAQNTHKLISDTHRVLKLAKGDARRLYGQSEFSRRAFSVSLDFWNSTVMRALQTRTDESVSRRLTAAFQRASSNAHVYQTRIPNDTAVATEALFDPAFCKPNESHVSRTSVHEQIKRLYMDKKPIRMALPLFSRKPVCPIKNRGHFPDLAEIVSLARCYELATLLSWIYPHGVEFRIFADGHKYRRACGTPVGMVDDYQESLRYWSGHQKITSLVTIIDYESAVRDAIGVERAAWRELQYEQTVKSLQDSFGDLFNAEDLSLSLRRIEQAAPLGQQVCWTFRSIVSSVYYRAADLSDKLRRHDDEAQAFYLNYISSLDFSAESLRNSGPAKDVETALEMRRQAWMAALRYVAISLTDRSLDVWSFLNADGFKFTIHSKLGEIRFRPTSSECLSITPQHCVGGLSHGDRGLKVTFTCRLERESCHEYPVMLRRDSCLNAGPVWGMASAQQPICYIASKSDPKTALEEYVCHE